MIFRSRACHVLGTLLLALAMVSDSLAGDAQQLLGTGTEIPGTGKKIGGISEARMDAENIVFAGVDDADSQGFGVIPKADAVGEPSFEWFDVSPVELLHKVSVSSPGMAYMGSDPTVGVPTIFGVADVAEWGPVELIKVGDDLPDGSSITELGAFDLAGKKLVFSAKKAGGAGLYEIPDITVGKPVPANAVVDTTAFAPGLGLFLSFDGVTADESSVFFSATAEEGAGVYLAKDGSELIAVSDTTQPIPIEGADVNFAKYRVISTGKKAVFWGAAEEGEGIFYTDDPFFKVEIKVAADTNTELPDGSGLFATFDTVSATDSEIAALADGTDGSRGIYMGADILSKKWSYEGQELDGKKISSLWMTNEAVGSLVFAAAFDDRSEGLLFANTSAAQPVPLSGIGLLLAAALGTVAYGSLARTRSSGKAENHPSE